MWYVLGENEYGDFEIWEGLTASEAMAVRNEYLKMKMQTRAGKMSSLNEEQKVG
tara:strand:- start:109 stop:270 length:162 start_codon:yes stop_codon:yes gene_type:complete